MKIKKEIIAAMIAHTKKDAPVEACGYIGAKNGLIEISYELANIDKSTDHFSFDPKEQFNVMRDARAKGIEICGVYHSHPVSPARPSAEDIKLAYDPNMVYVIVSLHAGKEDIKAYRIKDGKVLLEEMEIIA